MRTNELERRFKRIRASLAEAQTDIERLQEALEVPLDTGEMWARRMFGVLSEIAERGGTVGRKQVTAIGRKHGYAARGMAGFYQELLMLDQERDVARLTPAGRRRLKALRKRFETAKS